jgi:hypothetical protein
MYTYDSSLTDGLDVSGEVGFDMFGVSVTAGAAYALQTFTSTRAVYVQQIA